MRGVRTHQIRPAPFGADTRFLRGSGAHPRSKGWHEYHPHWRSTHSRRRSGPAAHHSQHWGPFKTGNLSPPPYHGPFFRVGKGTHWKFQVAESRPHKPPADENGYRDYGTPLDLWTRKTKPLQRWDGGRFGKVCTVGALRCMPYKQALLWELDRGLRNIGRTDRIDPAPVALERQKEQKEWYDEQSLFPRPPAGLTPTAYD